MLVFNIDLGFILFSFFLEIFPGKKNYFCIIFYQNIFKNYPTFGPTINCINASSMIYRAARVGSGIVVYTVIQYCRHILS